MPMSIYILAFYEIFIWHCIYQPCDLSLIVECTARANIFFKKVCYLNCEIYRACDGFPQSEATMQSKYPQSAVA
jgi:hypothetical protein